MSLALHFAFLLIIIYFFQLARLSLLDATVASAPHRTYLTSCFFTCARKCNMFSTPRRKNSERKTGRARTPLIKAPPCDNRASLVRITVTDTVLAVPTYLAVRQKCPTKAEWVLTAVRLGLGECLGSAGTGAPTPAPTVVGSQGDYGRASPMPSSAPTPAPSFAPSSTPAPTALHDPTPSPTMSAQPTQAPTAMPTTGSFVCADLFPELVKAPMPLVVRDPVLQIKWAPIFDKAAMHRLNVHPRFKVGEVWTLQLAASSSCSNDLHFSLYGQGGSLRVVVPAFAESVVVVVTDTIKVSR